jgi:hypothetical protein
MILLIPGKGESIPENTSASRSVSYRKVGGPDWATRDPHKERRLKSEHDSRGNLAMVRLYTTIAAMNPP